MPLRTNNSVVLFTITRGWRGAITEAGAGTISAWVETIDVLAELNKAASLGGNLDLSSINRGYFITDTDQDYKGMRVAIDGSTFEATRVDVFRNSKQAFHHAEVYFK